MFRVKNKNKNKYIERNSASHWSFTENYHREFYRRAFKLVLFIQEHDTTYHNIVIVSTKNLTFPLLLGYYTCVLSNVRYEEHCLKFK
jgi:hypothetical protein